jgi:hypothetical protein
MPSQQQIITQLGTRAFYQLGPAGPQSPVYYAVPGELDLTGVNFPINGAVTYMKVKGDRIGEWVRVAREQAAPAEITGKVGFSFKQNGIPRIYLKTNSINSYYVYSGRSGDMSRPNVSWTDWVAILANGVVTDAVPVDLVNMQGTAALKTDLTHIFEGFYLVGSLNFGIQAGTQITAEAMDCVYGTDVSIGDYTPPNDGTRRLYVVSQVTTSPPQLTYTVDGGVTYTNLAIANSAVSEAPIAIDYMGEYLIILSPTGTGATQAAHYYSLINSLTGVPAAFTKVSTGHVVSFQARDLTVLAKDLAFACADAGYIYKFTSALNPVTVSDAANATTSNLTRIHANGDTVVSVGAAGVVVKSPNRGNTWAACTPITATPALTAVFVQGPLFYWVGTATGRLYWTIDGGNSWTEFVFDTNGVGTVNDVQFVNSHVGYFAHTSGGATRIFWTIDGGQSWATPIQGNRVLNFPSASVQRINRITIPQRADSLVACNNVAMVGLGLTTDGQLVIGAPTVI